MIVVVVRLPTTNNLILDVAPLLNKSIVDTHIPVTGLGTSGKFILILDPYLFLRRINTNQLNKNRQQFKYLLSKVFHLQSCRQLLIR